MFSIITQKWRSPYFTTHPSPIFAETGGDKQQFFPGSSSRDRSSRQTLPKYTRTQRVLFSRGVGQIADANPGWQAIHQLRPIEATPPTLDPECTSPISSTATLAPRYS